MSCDMNINVIDTENDYEKALQRLEVIFDAGPGTKEGDELDALARLIERFEDKHYPIAAP